MTSGALKQGGAAHLEVRDPGLDGLRGYALIYIVLYHLALNYAPVGPLESVLSAALQAAWIGVDLFFVLSGYLITGILLGVGREPGAMLSFYIRRGVRVFPLYYAMLFFFFVLVPQIDFFERWNDFWVPGKEDTSTLWYWLYAANIKSAIEGNWSHQVLAVCWTLAIEEQFYLLWPWIVRGLGARKLLWVCAAILVAGPALRMWMIGQNFPPGAIYTFTLCRLDPLAVGSAIATLSYLYGNVDWLRRTSAWALALAALVFAGVNVVTAFYGGWTVSSSMVHPLMQSFGYTAVATVHGATLIMIVSDRGRGFFRRFFENGFLQMLGKYSYSVYLWHLAVAIFVGELWFDHVGRVEWNTSYLVAYCFVVSALTLALSRVTWLLIEEPALRLKRFAPYFRDRAS